MINSISFYSFCKSFIYELVFSMWSFNSFNISDFMSLFSKAIFYYYIIFSLSSKATFYYYIIFSLSSSEFVSYFISSYNFFINISSSVYISVESIDFGASWIYSNSEFFD